MLEYQPVAARPAAVVDRSFRYEILRASNALNDENVIAAQAQLR
jgi:hypothetical protein